jgi:hypothetical protein
MVVAIVSLLELGLHLHLRSVLCLGGVTVGVVLSSCCPVSVIWLE